MDSCYDEVGQQKGVVNIALLPGRLDDLPEPIFQIMDHFSRMEKVFGSSSSSSSSGRIGSQQ